MNSAKLQGTRSAHTSQLFQYTSNGQSEKNIKKIPFTIASKSIKQLGINSAKKVKELYTENHKTLLKELEQPNKWKGILCSWIERLNIVRMSVLHEVIYKFSAISIKIPMAFYAEMEKLILKFV